LNPVNAFGTTGGKIGMAAGGALGAYAGHKATDKQNECDVNEDD